MELSFSFALVIILGTKLAASFECFQCNSYTDQNCAYMPEKSEYLKECNLKVAKHFCLTTDTTELSKLSISDVCVGVRERYAQCQTCLLKEQNTQCNTTCEDLSIQIPIETTLCRKVVMKVSGKYENEKGGSNFHEIKERVTRQCGYIKHDDELDCISSVNPGRRQLSCSCLKTGCNRASNFQFQSQLMPSFLIFSTLYQNF